MGPCVPPVDYCVAKSASGSDGRNTAAQGGRPFTLSPLHVILHLLSKIQPLERVTERVTAGARYARMTLGQRLFMPVIDWRARRVARQVARFLAPPVNVLDFGSGNGLICSYVRRYSGASIVGLDTVPYAATVNPMVLYDGAVIPFADGAVDTVLSLFVLHHCSDPDAALDECVRVAGRRLLIIEDVYDGRLSKALLDADDWIANRIETSTVNVPFNFRTVPQWRAAFAARRLSIEAEERVWPLPRHPIKSVLFALSKEGSRV